MSELNVQISGVVDNFVAQVTALARKAAMQTLESALSGGSFAGPASRSSKPAKPVGRAVLAVTKLPKGAKRPAEQLEAIKAKLLEHIKSNPGQRVEQINQALGTTTKDLALPIKKLIADGEIKSKGEKRATTYASASKKS